MGDWLIGSKKRSSEESVGREQVKGRDLKDVCLLRKETCEDQAVSSSLPGADDATMSS